MHSIAGKCICLFISVFHTFAVYMCKLCAKIITDALVEEVCVNSRVTRFFLEWMSYFLQAGKWLCAISDSCIYDEDKRNDI